MNANGSLHFVASAEDRWIPVSESGQRFAPRSKAEADALLLQMPAGSTYSDGGPMDGVAHIVHERRFVTEWTEVAS